MKISCKTCGQILPKTAVMCPNCGGRTFLPIDENQAQQVYQQTLNQPQAQQNIQPNPNTWASEQTIQPTQPQQVAPQQPVYVPPVYVPPAQPQYQPQYQPPVQPQLTYQTEIYEPPAVLPPSVYNSRKLASQMLYAGFFKRGFAYVFDVVLVGLLLGLAYQLLLPEVVKQLKINGINDQTLIVVAVSFYLLYMSIFTSSGRQGTIGKMIMGLWVYGMNGQRINFFHALFRELLKVVLLPFAFVMWFTARKQTLADLLARTVVLYDPS